MRYRRRCYALLVVQAMQAFWTETAKEFMACNVRKEDFDKPAERYKQWRQALQDKLSADQ